MRDLYIGLMSGTSMDAVDGVLVAFDTTTPALLASHSTPMPIALKNELITLSMPGFDEINRMGALDQQVGELFADTAIQLLHKTNIHAEQIRALGSHGQTIRHQPFGPHRFSLQIGDPNLIAEKTGITTVADFRRRDMAKGGQGAPLVPAFHAAVLRNAQHNQVVLNLGGIANITWLPRDATQTVTGFDTGPANILLDAWAALHLQQPCDYDGGWAASGQINSTLLELLLTDEYCKLPAPKSTGREYFNLAWLEKITQQHNFALHHEAPQNVQATLCEFTARTIANAIKPLTCDRILICGGGIKNQYLLSRLRNCCDPLPIHSTEEFGIDPQWMEAMAFAWLAQQTLAGRAGNLPSVTGANAYVTLGGIYPTNILLHTK